MDEIKLGIAQHKGIRAQELLDNSLLQEVFTEIESVYLKEWRGSKAIDVDAREAAWRALKTLDGIRGLLKICVTNGKVAAADIKRLSEENKMKHARSN
jgi:hypothetical protein